MTDFKLDKLEESISGPLLLVILDGVGIYSGEAQGYPGNALDKAAAPVLKGLLRDAPVSIQIKAHGTAVGLPSDDDMGNSEVGHNAMGAGRIFDQGAKLVSNGIADGSLFTGDTWSEYIGTREKPGHALRPRNGDAQGEPPTVHFMGLLSDGNVHSHIDHLLIMLDTCAAQGVKCARIHILLDGRDVEKLSAPVYVEQLEAKLSELNAQGADYRIASGGGRMNITMDRYEADWAMVEAGWKVHVKGEGDFFASAGEAIEKLREKHAGVIDQNLPPFVVAENGAPVGPIQDGDVVIFTNFRGDRAIEISRAFTEEDFTPFKRDPRVKVHYAGMMEYDGDLHIPSRYLVAPPAIDRTVSEYLVKNEIPQYALSETQKYGHVTFFWNGNNSEKFNETLEEWKEIPSDNVSFDEKPRMKADELTDDLIRVLGENRHKFIRVNYANGDMVGHTGNLAAAAESVEAVDENLARLLEAADQAGATVIITADHGNCDQMIEVDGKGNPKKNASGGWAEKTSHTLSPVPFIVTGKDAERYRADTEVKEAGLGNLAATILTLLGLRPPEDYLPSLLKRREAAVSAAGGQSDAAAK